MLDAVEPPRLVCSTTAGCDVRRSAGRCRGGELVPSY